MKLVVYRDKQSAWRWRLKASNGRVIADSGEGYRRRTDCLRMARKIIPADIEIVVE